jgi:hypothetical protein
MSLLLCHRCFSWVEPIGEQCPQCDFPLDARSPDPPPAQLGAAIGRLVGRIGDVRISRTSLPDRGSLYETTRGLFFVPHRLEQVKVVPGLAPDHRPAPTLSSSLRNSLSLLWSPSESRAARMALSIEHQRPLGPQDSGKLPTLLMQNPGVFFLARHSIQAIRYSIWGWTIVRPNSLVLRLKPIADRNGFHDRMAALAADIREAVCP